MRVRPLLLSAIILIGGAGVAAAQMGGMMGGPGMMGQGRGMMGSARHFFYMHNGLPSQYVGKTNPLAETPSVLAEGRKLYAANCASCHGAEGRGDGPLAANLDPPPPDLAQTMSMPVSRDDFLYWTIAEGGAQFGSAMPAFKASLKPDQIWSIITALRSGQLTTK